MIQLIAEYPYHLHPLSQGRFRIDLPGSSLDGFIARDRQSAEKYLELETKRLVSSLLSSPSLQSQVAKLQTLANKVAPDLPMKVDLRQSIVFFPADEMLSISHTIAFLQAADYWRQEQGYQSMLDMDNYTTFLDRAQEIIRDITLENKGN